MSFSDFFAECCPGRQAYPYQVAFAEGETLPQLLNVPTGVGKTATAILGWLYRRRFASPGIRCATPRRLVYCLPMRTLVEQTHKCAVEWLDQLGISGGMNGVAVHILLGGEDSSDWDEHPERDAILIGTQDMLLSRALNRGYGMSRYRWPVHFGLLNNDCLWVMDETQLMGVGLTTTAQLQGLRERLSTYGVAHSIWMSATLDARPITTVDHAEPPSGFSRQALTEADRKHAAVQKRLSARKSLEKSKAVLSNDSEKKGYAKDLAAEVAKEHREGTLTLVVVNRVARAQEIYKELQKLAGPKTKGSKLDAKLALIHARFRQGDRSQQEEVLFAEPASGPGRIVVATQAIEAGVDVSAATMFTELAPWPSLVQRFGRCNRGGEFSDARVIWIDVSLKDDKDKIALPYEATEFDRSRGHLGQLDEVGPMALEVIQDERPKPIVHTLRRKDLLDLWDTTPDLSGNDLDISRFIRDADDTDLQFFWRELTEGQRPSDSVPAAERSELCSVAVWRARDFLLKLRKNKEYAYVWQPLERDHKWQQVDPDSVRPGMVLLLDRKSGGYRDDVGWTGDPKDKPSDHSAAGWPPEDNDDDKNIVASQWVDLSRHLGDVSNAVTQLKSSFAGSASDIPWESIVTAARWHDVGKAHPAFQNMLFRGREDITDRRSGLWAKSDSARNGRPRYFADAEGKDERIGFRHELASALAWLAHQGSQPDANLIAYLIAAHHGKVRGSIRSLPNEISPTETPIKFARGVRDGDSLPEVDLGNGETVPATSLDLGLMELGESLAGSSWLSRVLSLRDDPKLGPFRLGFLETLLRVADWMGSGMGETA